MFLERCALGESAHYNAGHLVSRAPYKLEPYNLAYKQSEFMVNAIEEALAILRKELEKLAGEQRALFA